MTSGSDNDGRSPLVWFVEFGELMEVRMSKSLMPQQTEGRATEGVDKEDLGERGFMVAEFREVHESR